MATCPQELVELRRQWEEKALIFPNVQVAHLSTTAASPLEIEELGGQSEETDLRVNIVTAPAIAQQLCTFKESEALLAIMTVPAETGREEVLMLCNEGAQVLLVCQSVAQRLGAGPGFPWTLSIQVVGEAFRDFHTRLYNIHLKDRSGQIRPLVATAY